MKPMAPLTISRRIDMSPEAIDQRLRDVAQIYKLGMSLRDTRWLGPVNGQSTPSDSATSVETAKRLETNGFLASETSQSESE